MSDKDQLKREYEQCRQECEKLQQQIYELRAVDDSETPIQRIAGPQTNTHATRFRVRRNLKGHYGKIYALDWSKDGISLVSASQDGKLMIWNASTENKRIAIPLRSAWVMSCSYSPGGFFVACGGLDNLCTVFRINEDSQGWEQKKAYRELQQHEGYLSCCKFVGDSQILTCSGDSTCLLWDIETQTARASFMEHTSDVMELDVWDERGLFISGSCDGTAKVWDYRQEKCVGVFTGHQSDINSVSWFPDGYAFGTGSDDATIRLFDTRAYRQLNIYRNDEIVSGVTSVKFSKSGKYLFSGYDENPWLMAWDTLYNVVTQEFTENTSRVSCLGINVTGQALATGSWDCNLRVWA